MLNIGTDTPTTFKYGTEDVSAIYLGTDLAWQPAPTGYTYTSIISSGSDKRWTTSRFTGDATQVILYPDAAPTIPDIYIASGNNNRIFTELRISITTSREIYVRRTTAGSRFSPGTPAVLSSGTTLGIMVTSQTRPTVTLSASTDDPRESTTYWQFNGSGSDVRNFLGEFDTFTKQAEPLIVTFTLTR